MYDLAIIGAGWAGFNAAHKARELGLKTLLVDKSELGGTCLNLGCIPTKTLIQSAKVLNLIKKSSSFGINSTLIEPDFVKIQEHKDKIIQQLKAGMRSMLKGIDFVTGEASFESRQEIRISGGDRIQAKNILIASGSIPHELKQFKFDGRKILSSNEVLSLKNIPNSLLVIGGGVIGCEFAGLFWALGSKVTVVEKMPQLLPGEDKDVARKIENNFKKKGIKVNTNTDASTLDFNAFEIILVCVGRTPLLEGLGLDTLGIKMEDKRIAVDDYLCSSLDNIYAAGDCVSKIMLAHFASYQGKLAAHNLFDPANKLKVSSLCVPSCIFTDPEIGSVGLNEEKALAQGLSIEVHKFDFLGSGMARIIDEADGFIKIVSDKNSGAVLGASIIGPRATELIGIISLAVSNSLKIEGLRHTLFAHPTLSESISDALN